MELAHKKILFIAPVLFGYERDIVNELERNGATVDFVPENLDHISLFYKALCSLSDRLRKKAIYSYFSRRIKRKNSYDIVFVIRGRWLDDKLLQDMRDKFDSVFVMYQWDSAKNLPNLHEISKYFDRIFTFDRNDSLQFGSGMKQWQYRPLFYADDFKNIKIEEKKEFDLLYIGSLHSGRARFLKILQGFAADKGLILHSHLYMKKISYLKRKWINKEYAQIQRQDIQHNSVSRKDLINYMQHSNIIVDYTNPNQTGFTMRSIECLGAKRKLITNNKEILKASFFCPDNIWVYDEDQFDIPEEFLAQPYCELEQEIYEQYSITSWVNDIFKDL